MWKRALQDQRQSRSGGFGISGVKARGGPEADDGDERHNSPQALTAGTGGAAPVPRGVAPILSARSAVSSWLWALGLVCASLTPAPSRADAPGPAQKTAPPAPSPAAAPAPSAAPAPATAPAPSAAPAPTAVPASPLPSASAPSASTAPAPASATGSGLSAEDQARLTSFGAAIGQGLADGRELQRLAGIARDSGDLKLTIRLLERSLSLSAAENRGMQEQSDVMRQLGDALAQTGEMERGRALLATSARMAEASGDSAGQLRALVRLGSEQWLAGAERDAEVTLLKAEALINADSDPVTVRELHLQLASLYMGQGQERHALAEFSALLPLLNTPDQKQLQVYVQEQQGWLLDRKGDRAGSREAWESARQLYRSLHDLSGEAQALEALARLSQRNKEYAAGAEQWKAAAEAWRVVPLPRQSVLALAQAAACLEQLEQWDQARPLLEQALTQAQSGDFLLDQAALQGRLAFVIQQQGDAESAKRLWHAAHKARASQHQPGAWIAPLGLARQSAAVGGADADDLYKEALLMLDRENVGQTLNPIDDPWLPSRYRAYDEVILRAMARKDFALAFDVAERARVRHFLDLRQARAGSPLLGALGSGTGHTLEGRGPEWEEISDRLDAVLQGESPSVNDDAAIFMPIWNLTRAQAFAQKNQTTLLAYHLLDHQIIGWVLTPDGRMDAQVLAMERERIQEWGGWLQERMLGAPLPSRSARAQGVSSSLASVQKLDRDTWWLLRDLHQALVAPFSHSIPTEGQSRLAVIGGDFLLNLPFGMLIDARGELVLQRHPIISAPIASLLEPLYVRRNVIWVGKSELYLIGEGRRGGLTGNGGAFSDLKTRLRQGTYKSNQDVYNVLEDLTATDEAAINALKRPTTVQLMTRGFFHRAHPWLAGFLFSRTGEVMENDGVLSIAELPAGQLQARLVMLPPVDGANLMPQLMAPTCLGWLGAGVQSLLVPVGNKTPSNNFYERMHQGLFDGMTPVDALREAQLAALARGEPFLWVAGQILVGAL